MIDSEIMLKYRITARELRAVYRQLFETKAVDIAELYCRPVYWDNNVDLEPRREFPRLLLAFILPVHDAEEPDLRGIVADVTEKGMRLEGMETEVGQKRKLVVNPSRFGDLDPIEFEAECRWNSTDGRDNRPVAGFQITQISEASLQELRRFIRFVTTGRTGKPEPTIVEAKDEITGVETKQVEVSAEMDKIYVQERIEEASAESKEEAPALAGQQETQQRTPVPTKKELKFNVSLSVNSPETFKERISSCITRELESLQDVSITDEIKSEFHIAVFAVEGDSRLFCSVAITRTIWTDVEFCMRRALLDMWERISDKPKEGLLYRGAVINEVLRRVGTDNSLKGIQDHWPMVVTHDALDKACEKIVSYLDSKFLEPKRRRRKQ
jgi:hypothetical protein